MIRLFRAEELETAIVILNWNGEDHLKKYLPHVIKHTNPEDCQIYIADNGSTDGSVKLIREQFSQCRLILLDQNYGFAGGYNKALQQIDARYFCLLNSDVRVSAGWIEPILGLFKKHSDITAIQPRILSDRDWKRFEHAGAAGGFVDKYGYPFCRGRIMDHIEYDRGQYNYPTDIFWASGACLFIRAERFKQVGGFDSDYFAHMEEIDLCWRLKNQGDRIVFCPDSKVYHWGGATLDYNNPHKLYLNFRNSLWTLYKNYTGRHLSLMMFRRMLIDTMAIVKYGLTFDFRSMMAVIRAHFDYYRSKKDLQQKRQILKSLAIKNNHPEIYPHSIVWQFFIHSKKTFSKLKPFKLALAETALQKFF